MGYPVVTYTPANGQSSDATQIVTNFSDLTNALSDGTKDLNCGGIYAQSGMSSVGDLTVATNKIVMSATSGNLTVAGVVSAPSGVFTSNLTIPGLSVARTAVVASTTYTVQSGDFYIQCVGNATITVGLPAAPSTGAVYCFSTTANPNLPLEIQSGGKTMMGTVTTLTVSAGGGAILAYGDGSATEKEWGVVSKW